MADDELDLADLMYVLRKRWLMILFLFIFIFGLIAWYTFTIPPTFEATAVVAAGSDDQMALLLKSTLDQKVNLPTQVEVIKSLAVMSPVYEKYGKDFDLTVTTIKDSQVIELTVQDTNPVRVDDIANAVAFSYQEYAFSQRQELAGQVLAVLDGQVNLTRAELDTLNAEYATLMSMQKLPAEQEIAYASLQDELKTARSDLDYLIAKRRRLQETLEKVSTGTTEQRAQLLADQQNALALIPEVDAQIALKQDRVHSLSADMFLLDQDRKLSSEDQIRYLSLQQMISSKQTQLNYLLSRQGDVGVLATQGAGSVRLVNLALSPEAPVKPNIPLNLIVGLLLGLGLACGTAYLTESFRGAVRTVDEKTFSASPIGTLPHLPKVKHKDPAHYITQHRDRSGHFSERMRMLRNNVLFFLKEHKAKIIMVSSSQAGDGKTTVATNLALSFAHNHQRVLLVDANIRHPMLDKVFHRPPDVRGLSDVVVDDGSVLKVVNESAVQGLDVIFAGSANDHPGELFGSERMKDIFEEIRKLRYDVVLVDAPAADYAESVYMSALVDGVLFVIAHDKTRTAALQRAKHSLRKARVAGVVENFSKK